MKLVLYPKYKPSGAEWLEEVPEHWNVKRLKRLLHEGESSFGRRFAGDCRS